MRCVPRGVVVTMALTLVAAALGAAPAAPSYEAVQRRIEKLREHWQDPKRKDSPKAAGWIEYLDALSQDLKDYAAARDEAQRRRRLDRLEDMVDALDYSSWGPAVALREEFRAWLEPRRSLASAARRIRTRLSRLPETQDEAVQANRQRWREFVEDDLARAWREYEAADEVSERLEALGRVRRLIATLREIDTSRWAPGDELHVALARLFDQPNVQAVADYPTVYQKLAREVVDTGPVFRRGRWAYVTAGPWLGFGLLHSDDGIAFFNRQRFISQANIDDFQQQIASDPQGRRAAKMYYFTAATANYGETTATVVLKPDGIHLYPKQAHNVQVGIGAYPMRGGGLNRLFAAMLGQTRERIRQKVYQGAAPEIVQGVYQGSAEESAERSAKAEAEQNAELRKYLVGNDTFAYGPIAVSDLHLASRPQYAKAEGRLGWRDARDQLGADMPKPAEFARPASGITADIHLTSVLNNLSRGFFRSDEVQQVKHLLVVIRPPAAEGEPPTIETDTKDADYATLLKRIEESRTSDADRTQVLRITRPSRPVEFGVDTQGRIVAVLRDLTIEVPAPRSTAGVRIGGPPAKVYRLVLDRAELVADLNVDVPEGSDRVSYSAKITGFDPGPGAEVFALNDDEAQPQKLNLLATTVVLGFLRGQLQRESIDGEASLGAGELTIREVSDLHPSGWIRVTAALRPDP